MVNHLLKFGYYAFVLGILLLGGLLFVSAVPVFGDVQMKIVTSGSMEPAIKTGSVVMIKKEETYKVGDVITFSSLINRTEPTTHRVISEQIQNGELVYQTKGDANPDPDTNYTFKSAVVGKVLFSIPFLGYVLAFAREPLGFVLMIVLPALAIILDEGLTIYREIRDRAKKEDDKETEVVNASS